MSNKPRVPHPSNLELLKQIRGGSVRPAQEHRVKVDYRRHEKHRRDWREERNDD